MHVAWLMDTHFQLFDISQPVFGAYSGAGTLKFFPRSLVLESFKFIGYQVQLIS